MHVFRNFPAHDFDGHGVFQTERVRELDFAVRSRAQCLTEDVAARVEVALECDGGSGRGWSGGGSALAAGGTGGTWGFFSGSTAGATGRHVDSSWRTTTVARELVPIDAARA